jgi:hypothetical protein
VIISVTVMHPRTRRLCFVCSAVDWRKALPPDPCLIWGMSVPPNNPPPPNGVPSSSAGSSAGGGRGREAEVLTSAQIEQYWQRLEMLKKRFRPFAESYIKTLEKCACRPAWDAAPQHPPPPPPAAPPRRPPFRRRCQPL